MAPRGKKRKAEAAALVATAEKREKVGSELPEVEETVVVIEHCTS